MVLIGVLGRFAANAPAGLPKVPAPIKVMPATPTTDPARRAANALVARLEVLGSPGRRTSLLIGVRIWGTSNSRGMTTEPNAPNASKLSPESPFSVLMQVHQPCVAGSGRTGKADRRFRSRWSGSSVTSERTAPPSVLGARWRGQKRRAPPAAPFSPSSIKGRLLSRPPSDAGRGRNQPAARNQQAEADAELAIGSAGRRCRGCTYPRPRG